MALSIPIDAAIREFVYSLIDVKSGGTLVDIGCGNGYDLLEIARLLPATAHLVGIERAESSFAAAKELAHEDSRISFRIGDADYVVPVESHSADAVFSKNLMECIVDKDAHVQDIHRMLKPGGRVICAHYDWDSQTIDGIDKDLVRRIVHGFGDCKQAWMNDCDSWMGRRLWRTFQRSGLFEGSIHTKVLTETQFVPGTYGYETICSFETLVRRGIIERDHYDKFKADIEVLASAGEYFYSITLYVYVGRAI